MTRDTKQPKFIDTFGTTRVGKDRTTNGDQFVVAELKRAAEVHHASKSKLDDSRRFGINQAHVLLVADGVSGQPGGRKASSLAVDEVMNSVLNVVPWTPDLDLDSEAHLRQELRETIVRCDDEVSAAGNRSRELSEMATTLTLAFVRWPTAFIVHAGDSRAYLIRDGAMEQLTTDHTLAQQLTEDGQLDAEDAATSRFAKMLWNAVGGHGEVTPELTVKDLQTGDALLLCSDGLTSCLSDRSIRHVVETKESAQDACEDLLGAVEAIGGGDDATVALARFEPEIPRNLPLRDAPRTDRTTAARSTPGDPIETATQPTTPPRNICSRRGSP